MNREPENCRNLGAQSFVTELGMHSRAAANDSALPAEQQLMQFVEIFGPKHLAKRRKIAGQMLRANGATHNVFDAPEHPRVWQFDPIPLVISADEWVHIEAGLVQRARLLNLILADIYGARKLFSQGLLPPELVYAHKGFLWPCVGHVLDKDQPLSMYSANLARGRDGRFWVLKDRTNPLFGSGYALENRLVMSHSFSGLFKDLQVHRLAMYFHSLHAMLTRLARHNQTDPRIVLLTPGPHHDAYFEHAYLAAYLGYPLVQGADLVVRDSCLWLKSVGGLRQVDVVLRRVDDALCDPLELHGDSLYGVPGLLEALRLGNVATPNPLGSSALENPGLMAFLPSISRALLGEELLLSSVATWWCGQPRECEFVLQNLDRLVIKSIHPMAELDSLSPGHLDAEQLKLLRARILERPQLYVGQEIDGFATVPSFARDEIEPCYSVLTTYLTAEDNSYVVMPGGLTRISPLAAELPLLQQESRFSKDTWVLTAEPDKQVNFWKKAQSEQMIISQLGSLPSRSAENLFWAARYAERTEAGARLMRLILIKLHELNEFHDADDQLSLNFLLQVLTKVSASYPGFVGAQAAKKLLDPRAELLSLACDANRDGSLQASLRSFGRATYAVRDLLPGDAWLVVDSMQQNWKPKISVAQIGTDRLIDSIDQLILQLAAFSGLTHENMSRELAWNLLNAGRRLERGLNLIELLRVALVPCHSGDLAEQMMEMVLATSNSLIVFRRRYRSFMQLENILELLLMDEDYPRSLAYQLRFLQVHIAVLAQERGSEQIAQDKQLIDETLSALRAVNAAQLTQLSNGEGSYPLLQKLLDAQQERLLKLSGLLTQFYFSPALVQQQVGGVIQERAS